jgi:CDP-diacylglycerol--glycerol-3-phosphate 3-phosphatidyltransferase
MNNSATQTLSLNFNVPNAITAGRIVLSIFIVWLLNRGGTTGIPLAGILLVIAWFTDWLDGFLARKLGQSSLGGAVFDLIADRLLMTPVLIMAVVNGFWWRTTGLMPLNPYPYVVIVVAGDLTVLAGVFIFMWKQRSRAMEFPPPTQIAKITYSVQMLTLVVAILGLGPAILLAVLMYLAIIFTLLSFYSYLKEGGYVFTR